MGNKVVGHYRKVPTTIGLRNVIAHNCRECLYDTEGALLPEAKLPEYIIHPERAPMNEGDRCGASAALKRRTERLASVRLPRKIQDNAAVAIEGNYSASPAWFRTHDDPNEWASYFQDIRTLLFERFGEENALHWAVHYDERTPHMHVIFVPLTRNQQKKPTKKERAADPSCKTRYVQSEELRYSSSNFLGGNVGLEILQDELYERVGKARGLERGQRGSRARHTDQYSWAAKLARERESLELKVTELAAKERELAQREAHAEYLKRFHARALELMRGEDPLIIDQTKASLLLAGLDQGGFDELYAKALPLADEIRGRQSTRSAAPGVGDEPRPSKSPRNKEREDNER